MTRRPRPRSIHGNGEGWNWALIRQPKTFGIAAAGTKITSWFRMPAVIGGKRTTVRKRVTVRKPGRRAMAKLHPHRFRRRY